MPLQRQSRPAAALPRMFEAGVDALLACLTLFVVMTFYGWLIPVIPGLDDGKGFAYGLCSGQGPCDMTWIETMNGSSGITFWVSVVVALVIFVLTSGALGSTRRSVGMTAASTLPVPRDTVGSSETSPPSRAAMSMRWVIVLVVFIIAAFFGGGPLGVAAVVALWLPSLFGPRLAVYDWLTGVAIVEVALVDSPATAEVELGQEP